MSKARPSQKDLLQAQLQLDIPLNQAQLQFEIPSFYSRAFNQGVCCLSRAMIKLDLLDCLNIFCFQPSIILCLRSSYICAQPKCHDAVLLPKRSFCSWASGQRPVTNERLYGCDQSATLGNTTDWRLSGSCPTGRPSGASPFEQLSGCCRTPLRIVTVRTAFSIVADRTAFGIMIDWTSFGIDADRTAFGVVAY